MFAPRFLLGKCRSIAYTTSVLLTQHTKHTKCNYCEIQKRVYVTRHNVAENGTNARNSLVNAGFLCRYTRLMRALVPFSATL